jgi:NADH dehydrogenase
VILLEGAERVLPPFPQALSARAREALVALGVDVRTRAFVREIDERGVTVSMNDAEQRIEARTVIWGAGVRAHPLGARLAEATGADLDRGGRVVVGQDLAIAGRPEIFVIGDLAQVKGANGEPLPGVAPVAIQQGKYVARAIRARVGGRDALPFRYQDRGSLATIGRSKAVADLGVAHVSGFVAWVLWLFVHLMYLVGFENRVLVLIQWGWSYVTWNRGARLITGEQRLPDLEKTGAAEEPHVDPHAQNPKK